MPDEPAAHPPPSDWTTGPAKWLAVVILGAASITGMVWSMKTRTVRAPGLAPVRQAAAGESTGDGAERDGPAAPAPLEHKININSAPQAELELLPGVGPALAARIVEYRTARGGFKSIEELDNVSGIGPRILEKVRPLVTLE